MLDRLRGFRTYIAFGIALAAALAAKIGLVPTAEQNLLIAQLVEWLTDPVLLSLLAWVMRSVTHTSPGQAG